MKALKTNDQINEWVIAAQNGDIKAFEHIVEEYNRQIYNLALKILQDKDDALDVMQDTFLTAYEKINSFNFKSKFYTWLYRIATNHALMKIRKNKKAPLSEHSFEKQYDIPFNESVRAIDFSAEKLLLNKELKKKLEAGIAELPEIYKAVFILRDIENLSIKETGMILGITESNVKIRLKRARIFLKEYIEKIFSEKGAAYELS